MRMIEPLPNCALDLRERPAERRVLGLRGPFAFLVHVPCSDPVLCGPENGTDAIGQGRNLSVTAPKRVRHGSAAADAAPLRSARPLRAGGGGAGASRPSSSDRARRRDRRAGAPGGGASGRSRPSHRPAHEPHRLRLGTPSRAGHPGDGDRTSASKRRRAPSAMASATSAETAPWRSISAGSTPSSAALRLVGVGDDAADHVVRGARPLGQTRGHQPAGARLGHAPDAGRRAVRRPGRPRATRRWRTACRRGGRRTTARGPARPPRPPRARKRVTTSTSPRRRHVVTSRSSSPGDLALGHPQRLGDLRLRDAEHAQHALLVAACARRSRPRRPRPRSAAGHISWSSRGGPGSTTTVGPGAVRRRHHEPGRGARRVEHRGALRDHRLLAGTGLIASGSTFLQRVASGRTMSAIRCRAPSSRRHGPAREAAHDLRRQVVGGRAEATARDHEVDALLRP